MEEQYLNIETNGHSYNLVIGVDLTKKITEYFHAIGIKSKSKILLITDQNVASLYLNMVRKYLQDFDHYEYIVQAGETAKSLEQVEKITTFMIEKGFDRSSYILAFGGGVVGDLSGFVAAIYMRGISFIQYPTTILAHDSSVGGKVGINHILGKNLMGAFHQPDLVIYDTQFLRSLPNREVRSGLSEVIKHGLIADPEFITWLYQNAEQLLKIELDTLGNALYQGVKVKASIVSVDEKEHGIRANLNFGHTLAHAIETLSNYHYSHGEAVAIGMAFATHLARHMGYISTEIEDYYLRLLKLYQLPVSIPSEYSTQQIINIMMRDKKFKNSVVRMVLPTGIGEVSIVEGITTDILQKVIEEQKNL